IQNKWTIKVVNKSNEVIHADISVTGPAGLTYVAGKQITIQPGNVGSTTLLVRIPKNNLTETSTPVHIHVKDLNNDEISADYETAFLSPKKR
ncbi:MAG TPA: cytochrome c oxidase accessory protein CcoG, partial [Thiomicrospira sp.]|nr:cytochrome c oxidase accessory protein CcoG [Thiomicrospira sp.]